MKSSTFRSPSSQSIKRAIHFVNLTNVFKLVTAHMNFVVINNIANRQMMTVLLISVCPMFLYEYANHGLSFYNRLLLLVCNVVNLTIKN